MESAVERNQFHPLWRALFKPVFARHFDRKLTTFRARIGKKYRVGKAARDQFVGQRLLLWNLVQVGHMP